jgi:hypothetical protein
MMRATSPKPLRPRRRAVLALGLAVGMLAGCDDIQEVSNSFGLDCGLIANDLRGDWTVDPVSAARTLVNCEDPIDDGSTVTVSGTPVTYTNVQINASEDGASYGIVGDAGDPLVSRELTVGVEADSCLALVRFWLQGEDVFLVCLGTFDIPTRIFSATCDSAEVDVATYGSIDNTCDLNAGVTATVSIAP